MFGYRQDVKYDMTMKEFNEEVFKLHKRQPQANINTGWTNVSKIGATDILATNLDRIYPVSLLNRTAFKTIIDINVYDNEDRPWADEYDDYAIINIYMYGYDAHIQLCFKDGEFKNKVAYDVEYSSDTRHGHVVLRNIDDTQLSAVLLDIIDRLNINDDIDREWDMIRYGTRDEEIATKMEEEEYLDWLENTYAPHDI